MGLLCCALGGLPLAAQDKPASIFKILKLEGHQVRWALPAGNTPRVVTYRLVTEERRFPNARNCHGLVPLDNLAMASRLSLPAIHEELRSAFGMWEAAANIVFREAADGAAADIQIGAQSEPEGWAYTDVFYDTASREAVTPINKALICLNPAKRWKIGFDGDLKTYDLRYTLAHEIGHAIGLDHPPGSNQIMHFRYEERFRSLQPGDIRGAVAIYGAPPQQPGLVVAGGAERGAAAATRGQSSDTPASPAPSQASPVGGRALGK